GNLNSSPLTRPRTDVGSEGRPRINAPNHLMPQMEMPRSESRGRSSFTGPSPSRTTPRFDSPPFSPPPSPSPSLNRPPSPRPCPRGHAGARRGGLAPARGGGPRDPARETTPPPAPPLGAQRGPKIGAYNFLRAGGLAVPRVRALQVSCSGRFTPLAAKRSRYF